MCDTLSRTRQVVAINSHRDVPLGALAVRLVGVLQQQVTVGRLQGVKEAGFNQLVKARNLCRYAEAVGLFVAVRQQLNVVEVAAESVDVLGLAIEAFGLQTRGRSIKTNSAIAWQLTRSLVESILVWRLLENNKRQRENAQKVQERERARTFSVMNLRSRPLRMKKWSVSRNTKPLWRFPLEAMVLRF